MSKPIEKSRLALCKVPKHPRHFQDINFQERFGFGFALKTTLKGQPEVEVILGPTGHAFDVIWKHFSERNKKN